MTDKELLEQFQLIMQHMATKGEVRELNQQIAVMEDKVLNKLSALTDGYKLTHEKQWELERRIESLEYALEEVKNRIAV